MGTFLIILIILFVCWPWITKWTGRWFRGFMSRRAEDMMRRMMGMPSRKEEKRRRSAGGGKRDYHRQWQSAGGRSYRRPPRENAATLMKSVAVDVEYTEIKEFNSASFVTDDGRNVRIVTERQVSDVEYTEIKEVS